MQLLSCVTSCKRVVTLLRLHFALLLHKAGRTQDRSVWLRTSFIQGPSVSRRSTGYQRVKADSGGRNMLATLVSGLPAEFGHKHRSSEGRSSVGAICRRQSVSGTASCMSPPLPENRRLQAANGISAAANCCGASAASAQKHPLEQTASELHELCAGKVLSLSLPKLQRVEWAQGGRRSSVGGRHMSSIFPHSHLAMISAGSKAGSVLLHGPTSPASTPALQVYCLHRTAFL